MKYRASTCILSLFTLSLFAQQSYPPFLHGIASGDPLADKVILWTRVSPADSTQPVSVNWRIATDTSFSNIINSGSFTTDSSRDFTVKVDADSLQPGTTYYYDFETGGNHSAIGRTKTVPEGTVSNVRFAVTTCAKYSKGYFNAYARIGDRDDIDAVIHLGDYIYESKDSGEVGRVMLPFARCSTVVQFRTRYRQYHNDPDLVYARSRHPFINVWDDHETGNDSWANGNEHFPDSMQYAVVKQAGMKVYFEWVPIRENASEPNRIYRAFQYGDLVDLILLDTRSWRMQPLPYETFNMVTINDSNRTILGHEQYDWLINQLDSSTTRWRIIGQQVMIAPALLAGNPVFIGQWDNFPAERANLFSHIENNGMDNVVVLTGDVHAAIANDLPKALNQYVSATGEGSVAVEFITPAIASSRSGLAFPISLIKSNDPHIQYAEFDKNGYMILDVTADKAQGDYYYVPTTDVPDSTEELGASFYTQYGTKFFHKEPSSARWQAAGKNHFIKVYPNPATSDEIMVEIKDIPSGQMIFRIADTQGKTLREEEIDLSNSGSGFSLNIKGLEKGIYFLKGYSKSKEFYSAKFAVAE